jgi:hypothetical protein
MPDPDKALKNKEIINSKVRAAILFLVSDIIPNDENFDFIVSILSKYSIEEAMKVIYDNYYDEILEWAELNEM